MVNLLLTAGQCPFGPLPPFFVCWGGGVWGSVGRCPLVGWTFFRRELSFRAANVARTFRKRRRRTRNLWGHYSHAQLAKEFGMCSLIGHFLTIDQRRKAFAIGSDQSSSQTLDPIACIVGKWGWGRIIPGLRKIRRRKLFCVWPEIGYKSFS